MILKIRKKIRYLDLILSAQIEFLLRYRDFGKITYSSHEADKRVLPQFAIRILTPILRIHPYPLESLLLLSSNNCFHPNLIVQWDARYCAIVRMFFETTCFLRAETEIYSSGLPLNAVWVGAIQNQDVRGYLMKGKPIRLHFADRFVITEKMFKQSQLRLPLVFSDDNHGYRTSGAGRMP